MSLCLRSERTVRFLLALLASLLMLIFSTSVAAQVADPMKSTANPWRQAEQLSHQLRSLVQVVRPSVVGISTTRSGLWETTAVPDRTAFSEVLRDFFGEEHFNRFLRSRRPGQHVLYPEGSDVRHSQGSGVIVSADGYILTNHHIVGSTDEVMVKLHDGRSVKAKVLGSDRKSNLALLKVEADKLQPATLGDSNALQLCDWVLAIGCPYGLDYTVVHGMISARSKGNSSSVPYEEFLQTDAPIQPGNSGGPLVNLKGEVIGINSALFSRHEGGQALNFAIPINRAKKVLESLKQEGKVAHGWLGVGIQNLTADLAKSFGLDANTSGVLVNHVEPASPAEKAGLRGGDVIVRYQEKEVSDAQALREAVAETKEGTEVKLHILRDGKERALTAEIAERPAINTTRDSRGSGVTAPFGLEVQVLTPELAKRFGHAETTGVIIADVRPGSMADLAGLRPGALVLEVNRKKVSSPQDYRDALTEANDPNTVLLLVRHDQATQFIILKRS